MVPTLTPAFIIPEGIGGGLSGGSGAPVATAAGVVAAGVIAGGVIVAAAPVVAAVAAKAGLLTAASPLGLLAVGSFLKGLEQLREWGLVNYRPQPITNPIPFGQFIPINTTVDVPIVVTYKVRRMETGRGMCGPPETSLPNIDGGIVQNASHSVTGVGVTVQRSSRVTEVRCGTGTPSTGPNTPPILVQKANGTTVTAGSIGTDQVSFSFFKAVTTDSITDLAITASGVPVPLSTSTPQTFAPGVRPNLFPPTVPDAPVLPAPPGSLPAAPVLPPAPPDRRPLAPPVIIPRPGQQPARVPVAPGPGGQPVPGGVVRIRTTTTGQFVPAQGPITTASPPTVVQTPPEVVVVDGQLIGGPAQAPRPNLTAIAQELGRQERKLEIALTRPENGGLGELGENSLLAILRGLLERLVSELLNGVDGGSFTLTPACPPSGGAEPPPPVEVPYGGGGNASLAVLAKLDGIASLIQEHKNMGQPTCKTAISGQEVTVHFESDA